MGTVLRRSRTRALLRPLAVLPAWMALAMLRLGVAVLWPVAWVAAFTLGRAPRWWRPFAWRVTRRAARVRAYGWLLTDRAPRRAAAVVVLQPPPGGALPRRSVLARLLLAPWYLLLRYLAGVVAALLATAAWTCLVFARRHPAGLRAAQFAVQAYATDVDCWLLLLSRDRPRLPEPDPRLRPRVRPLGDHGPLPAFTRRLGAIAIAVDLVGGMLVSSVFYGAEGTIWLIFLADLSIQFLAPYIGIYLASQTGPLSVAQFGLHAIRPLRSLAWAVALIVLYALMLLALFLLVAPFAADSGGGVVPDDASVAWIIAFVGVGTVVAPVLEEFFYRGFLFQALRDGRGTWGAAVISSLAFSVAHFEFSPFALADRALIGIGLCWLFARTGRLLPGMFAHSINNAIVIPLIIGWDWQIAVVLPASLAIIAALATVASRRRGEWSPV